MTFTDEFTFTSVQLVSIFYTMLRFVGLLINTHMMMMMMYHCVPLLYTTQYRTVLIIFSVIIQIIFIAQMMSTGGSGNVVLKAGIQIL